MAHEKKHKSSTGEGRFTEKSEVSELGKVMRDLTLQPRVMHIGQFPGALVPEAAWKSRLENLRVEGDKKEAPTIAVQEYGNLAVKTWNLADLLPGLNDANKVVRKMLNRIVVEDPETKQRVETDNYLEGFREAVCRWFSYPRAAFVFTDEKDCKTVWKDDETGLEQRLHCITFNSVLLHLDSWQRPAVGEIVCAMRGTKLTINEWCYYGLVADTMLHLKSRRVMSLGNLGFAKTAMIDSDRDRIDVGVNVSDADIDRAVQICRDLIDVREDKKQGDIEAFMKHVVPLLTPPGVEYHPDVIDEIRRTYHMVTVDPDSFGKYDTPMWEREQYLSIGAQHMLIHMPWELLWFYIKHYYPLGKGRVFEEVMPGNMQDPNEEANRKYLSNILDLHPAVRARRARLLRRVNVEERDQPWRGPRRYREDLGGDVMRDGPARILDLVMRYSGRVRLFKHQQ